MRLKKREIQENLELIQATQDHLTNFQLHGGKLVKVQDLFKASLKHDEAEIQDLHQDNADVDMTFQRPRKAAEKLSEELRKVVEKIDKKLIGIHTIYDSFAWLT